MLLIRILANLENVGLPKEALAVFFNSFENISFLKEFTILCNYKSIIPNILYLFGHVLSTYGSRQIHHNKNQFILIRKHVIIKPILYIHHSGS